MKEETINFIYSKNDNITKYNHKRKDSKQAKVLLLLEEYFNNNNELTKDKFDEFLIFIDLKSIWYTKEEQNILWNSILLYSNNKTSIDYDAALKGIMDLFKSDDEDIKLNSTSKETFETFDKYLKSLNGNQEFLYDIEFINYIFFDKENIHLNDNNINNIINNIKLKYKFISLNEKEIKNYFSLFNSNINKDLIIKINTLIENILVEQNNNNNYIIPNDHSNNNSRSISFSTSGNDTNSNKNTNSFTSNHNELFDKLSTLDKIIFDTMDSLINFYKNNNLIILTKKYIQNYILFTKNNIYNKLKLLIEKDNKRKVSVYSKFSVQNEDITNNIFNNNIIKNFNINKIEKPKSKTFTKQESIDIEKELIKDKSYNKILNINKYINENINNKSIINFKTELDEAKERTININKDDDNNYKKDDDNNFNKIIISKKDKHNRIKSDTHEKLMTLNFNKKLRKNISYCNFNKLNQIKESDIFNLNNKSQNLSRNNFFKEKISSQTQNEETSFFEESIEDLNVFTFSNNLNEHYLIQNIDNLENLEEENNLINKGTPTLNPVELIDNKESDQYFNDDSDYYDVNLNEKNINEKQMNKEKNKLLKCKNPINFTFGKDENNEKKVKIKLSGDIDSKIPNYINNINNNLLSLPNQNNKKFIRIGYYDFKYLYKSISIKKLFNKNNEKINLMKFLTDEVYIIPNNGLKKQKSILVISATFIYLLKANPQMTFISKVNIKSLKTISISSRNCNLILFSFEKASDIFIETYRRIELLTFIKENFKENNIKIHISHSFTIKKKHGDNDSNNLKKNKIFTYTPNFENAQKLGILWKYQENFFSAKFQEKLVVLCCLGLMYFEENERCPKVIIPIIGTTIKYYTFEGTEKLYCFQLKTINDDIFIFGTKIKKEIFDWIHEFSLVKKKYFLKLKEIEPNLVVLEKNKIHKKKA